MRGITLKIFLILALPLFMFTCAKKEFKNPLDPIAFVVVAPTELRAFGESASTIRLSWKDNSRNEEGFKIQRYSESASEWIVIASIARESTGYIDTGLIASTRYSYRIYGYSGNASSPHSNTAEANTLDASMTAPSNFTATAASFTEIQLSWQDNSADEQGFMIERRFAAGGGWLEIAAVPANSTFYSDSGVSWNTAYDYRVKAYKNAAESRYAETSAATGDPLPAAPSDLQITVISDTAINIYWDDNSNNEEGFIIERKTWQAGTWTEVARVSISIAYFGHTGYFFDTGLTPNTEYYYRVAAYNSYGSSDLCPERNAATFAAAGQPPAAPSNLTATALAGVQIQLAWTDQAGDETGFKIERKTGEGGIYSEIMTLGANATSYDDTVSLSTLTAYYYRIRAYNGSGYSAYSNEANARTTDTPPLAPTNFEAQVISATRIDLLWIDASNNEQGFALERKTGAGAWGDTKTVSSNVAIYSDDPVSPNTQYTYRIRSYNSVGFSAWVDTNAVTTPGLPPAAPSNLQATAISSSRIDLSWTDNSTNEEGFKIERKLGASGNYSEISTIPTDINTYSNTGLSNSTNYYYRVRAYSSSGNSSYSNESNTTTLGVPPNAPSNTNAQAISSTQITVTWQDNASNEEGQRIVMKTGSSDWGNTLVLNVNQTSQTFNNLTPQTTYYFKVMAYNSYGPSAWSGETFATTLYLPTAPSNLQSVAISSSRIDLSWTDNSTTEEGFKIERKQGASGNYSEITTIPTDINTYSDTGLSHSTDYYYRVRAYSSSGNSSYSNEANRSTLTYQIPPNMVLISAGEFQMGDNLDSMLNALPIHTVTIDAFYINLYEVTFDEYDTFCDATGRAKPSDNGWGRGTRPAIRLSWYDAVAYCNWRSEQAGLEKCYDGSNNIDITKQGYRMPTEAEWEKAARGGLIGKRYPWGNSLDGIRANYYNGGDGYDNLTAPVGTYPANGYGLYDMAGNACEWCNDWYQDNYYNSSSSTNPTGAASGTYRVIRGGAWGFDYGDYFDTNGDGLRCAYRGHINPADWYGGGNIGFRIVRTQ